MWCWLGLPIYCILGIRAPPKLLGVDSHLILILLQSLLPPIHWKQDTIVSIPLGLVDEEEWIRDQPAGCYYCSTNKYYYLVGCHLPAYFLNPPKKCSCFLGCDIYSKICLIYHLKPFS